MFFKNYNSQHPRKLPGSWANRAYRLILDITTEQCLSLNEVLGFRMLLFSGKQVDSMLVHFQVKPLIALVAGPTLLTSSLLPLLVLALEGVCE